MKQRISVAAKGIELGPSLHGSFDVYFDGAHVWSFTRGRTDGSVRVVAWPRPMRHWLKGVTEVVVRQGTAAPLITTEVDFGTHTGRVRMVDDAGVPVMIDKWGLIQRPFSGRGEGVVEQLVDVTDQVLRALAEDLDIHAWVAFGSLLGAAREGGVIAHDSDVDIAFLSRETTPVGVNREMYEITRVLRRHGHRVLNKAGSFVTVIFKAPDGAMGSLDIYTCFYIGDLLHETATIRRAVPRTAIEPLGEISFEGRMLPAPADPDTMLEVSYGKGWRVPDPSFQHKPGRAVTDRFDDWTGSFMKARREWERLYRDQPDSVLERPTAFGSWVLSRLPGDSHVIDVGAGCGRDVLAFARAGHPATGLDFARGAFVAARRVAKDDDLPVTLTQCNLSDRRDVLTQAALVARRVPGARTVVSGGLLDSLEQMDRENLYPLLRLLVGRGGTALLEFAHDLSRWTFDPAYGGKRHPVQVAEVEASLAAIGGRIAERTQATAPDGMATTRLVVQW